MEHPLVQLARLTIETYLKEGKSPPLPRQLTQEMQARAGVFVSLHRRHALRGCIGTFAPTTANVAQEIMRNAVSASTEDPRFSPMTTDELADLEISVDVLSAPEPVRSAADLDAKKYGVIVKSGPRRGLLLPDLDGVNTPEEQIAICRQKGGIANNEPVDLFRFTVTRYH
ncbi:MAG: AmmeMemoRadiSam system protein A [Candidatus Margulisbacteria bacterium]|nr:AmmeMemoRadiSam system protein A [Candidatus Margulisiibacteriota bacterium]MBU1617259.1 AmmeMemoRadiSam system protein A [Candidatus Margulisiibacteriota bacterium]